MDEDQDLDDERAIELSSIAAIFPELDTDPQNAYRASLDLPVTPEKPLKIYFQSSTQTSSLTPAIDSNGEKTGLSTAALNIDVHQLSHLPPLKLEILLLEGYPSTRAPNVTVQSQPAWLPAQTLRDIQAKCEEFWEEAGHDQVLYTFIDYVQQEAEKAFGLADNFEGKFELPSDLKLVLLDYDLKQKRTYFENETFPCGICLEPKKGKICHRLMLCGHVFCVACLQDYYNDCIKIGDIDNVKCLDPGCGKITHEVSPGKKRKIDHTLNPSELLQIPIEKELVQRYVRLKRKKRLEADKNTVYCPRQWCQAPAQSKRHPKSDDMLEEEESDHEVQDITRKKKKDDPEAISMGDRLSICEDCRYAFCSVCKKGWHGELASCNPRRQAELNEEEKASLEYMQRFSTPCPTCNAPAQKTMGCNHMICFKCKTHFCYLCSAYLMPENPYHHFNDFKSTCYMRLWELEGGDGADVGLGYRGGDAVAWEIPEESDDESEEELEDEDHGAFAGDDVIDWDEDTDDEEPAPDQRRPGRQQIEIVMANGAQRIIDLPDQPARVQAPGVQRGGNRGRGRGRGRGRRRGGPAARPVQAVQPVQRPIPAPVARIIVQQPVQEDELIERPMNAAPGQGNNADEGIQRFLRLALEDREDEWDSDENLDVEDPLPRNRPQRVRDEWQ